jgi:TPR repeat protein
MVGLYREGNVAKNNEATVKSNRLSDVQDLVVARFNVGVAFHSGPGARKTVAEAVKWFKKAAEQGAARNYLGFAYYLGEAGIKTQPTQ